MLTIKTTRQHPRPAIYHGIERLRDVGEDLNRARWQVKAANRVLARHQEKSDKVAAAKRALAICAQLGPSRPYWTRRTLINLNQARALS